MKWILPITIAVLAVFANGNVTAQVSSTPPCRARTLDYALIPLSGSQSEFQIMNFLGVVVYRQTVQPDMPELIINTSALTEGFYFCRIISADGTETAKFLVRH